MPSATDVRASQTLCPECGRPGSPGKFCAGCGTRLLEDRPGRVPHHAERREPAPSEFTAGAKHHWLPAGIAAAAVIALAAVTAVVLLSIGGDPVERSAPERAAPVSVNAVRLSASNLYAPVEGDGVSGIVPAGWSRKTADMQGVVGGITAVSAQDKDASVTLGMLDGAGSLAASAGTLRDERKAQSGYRERSFRRLTLAGQRPAWKLVYVEDGRTTVEYVTTDCDRTLIVSGTAPERLFRTLENRFGVVARSFQAVC